MLCLLPGILLSYLQPSWLIQLHFVLILFKCKWCAMWTADHTFINLRFYNLHFAPIQSSWSDITYLDPIKDPNFLNQLSDTGLETSQQATILLPEKSTMLSYYTSVATCLSLSLQSTKIQAPGHFIFRMESKVLAPCKPISNRLKKFKQRSERHKNLFLSHIISLKNKQKNTTCLLLPFKNAFQINFFWGLRSKIWFRWGLVLPDHNLVWDHDSVHACMWERLFATGSATPTSLGLLLVGLSGLLLRLLPSSHGHHFVHQLVWCIGAVWVLHGH